MKEELQKRTDEEAELIVKHIKWRHEFESSISTLAHMCDPEIEGVMIVWANDINDIKADYKAAKKAYINRSDISQNISVDCDSPMAIVKDIWRRME